MSTTWTFANVHDQHGTITKAADGSWSWLVDSVNDVDPPTESISVNGSTVQMSFTQDGTSYLRYTWPSSVSSSDGDIVAADGTAVTGFTHSWDHTSLGTGFVTITLDSSGTGGGGGTGTSGAGWGGSFYNVTPTHFSYKVFHTSAFTSPQTYELHSTTLTPTFISDLVVGAASGSINSRTHNWTIPDVVQIRDAYGTVAAELTLAHNSTNNKKVFRNFW